MAEVALDAVSLAYGHTEVLREIQLEVRDREFLVVCGPSGSGKSTLLRVIAGLARPGSGTVRIGDQIVSSQREWVRADRRHVGVVFQTPVLFPHLDVAGNIAFGLRRRDRETPGRVAELLEVVGLAGFGQRGSDELSGGQIQRVALARALAPMPRVLLFDEPFSQIDASYREQLRSDVIEICRREGVTSVFVTHDLEEAFELGDRLALLHDGMIEQVDTAREIYHRPTSTWAAAFTGSTNLIPVEPIGDTADSILGSLRVHPRSNPDRRALLAVVRPEEIRVESPEHSAVHAVVESVRFHGASCDVRCTVGGQEILVRCGGTSDVRPGQHIGLVAPRAPVALVMDRNDVT